MRIETVSNRSHLCIGYVEWFVLVAIYSSSFSHNFGLPFSSTSSVKTPRFSGPSDITYIVSFKKVGTTTVTFTANDSIDSNAATITVKDKKAEEAAKKAKEEQERLAEEKAKKEAEEKAAQEKAAQEKAAQEAAAAKAKAEAEAAAQAQAQAEAQQQAQAAAQAQAQQQQARAQQQAGGTVYWVPNGQVYHSTPDCPSLGRSSTIYSGTIAQSGKSRPCKNCY